MPIAVVSGQFSGTGQSPSVEIRGEANVSLWGTFTGTVKIERSHNNGATWVVVSRDSAGNEASYTAPCSVLIREPEPGILFRLDCTAFSSGPINYRISQ